MQPEQAASAGIGLLEHVPATPSEPTLLPGQDWLPEPMLPSEPVLFGETAIPSEQKLTGFEADQPACAVPAPARCGRQVLLARFGLAPSGDPKRSPWRTLGNRELKRYFVGSVTSDFGTWIQNTAQVLLAYRLTHSIFAIGLVTCAQFSTPLLLAPVASFATSRLGAMRTLRCTQVLSALVAAALGIGEFTGHLTETSLIIGATAIGLCFTFALPARTVTVRTLVAEEEVKAAMAMDAVSYNLGRAVAPLLSVVVITTIGFGWAFGINAISFVIFSVVLFLLPERHAAQVQQRRAVLTGFKVALTRPKILILLLMVAAVTVADDPIQVLGPALATRVFHGSDDWSACFIGALGAGSVLGSLVPRRESPSIRRAAVVLCLLGMAMGAFALAPWALGSVIAAFVAGVACLLANSATRALLLEHAGRQYEVSVMAVWAIAWAGSKPIASFLDGTLASHFGVQWTGILLAVPALVPALVLLCWPTAGRRSARTRLEPAPLRFSD